MYNTQFYLIKYCTSIYYLYIFIFLIYQITLGETPQGEGILFQENWPKYTEFAIGFVFLPHNLQHFKYAENKTNNCISKDTKIKKKCYYYINNSFRLKSKYFISN